MTVSNETAGISEELWKDIDVLDEHDLGAFDDCFGNDDEFFDMVIDASAVPSHYNRDGFFDGSKKRMLGSEHNSVKRTKSLNFSTLQNYSCDESVISELNTDASVQSAKLAFLTPLELDQQLDQSMSRLALSMKRSELSRQKVISNPSISPPNAFGLSSFLRGASTRAKKHGTNALVGSGRSHLRSYMNHMGSTI